MSDDPRLDTDRSGGVTIGHVLGGIRGSIIAGRDVILGTTEQQRAMRNRRAMLELVKNTWIKGVLQQSLHGEAMIELGMEVRPDAVEHPWDMVFQMPGQGDRELPAGAKIIDAFDEANGSLIILGKPGSGKTTALLDLARDTIARAEEDPLQPIPVVFHLSSWAEKRLTIADWLVEELNSKYQIPKRIAVPWIEEDHLLLLLDGLDEVAAAHRDACVEAINSFLQEHMMPTVVCSRLGDYEALIGRLRLRSAVVLQPLTPEQINGYLAETGGELMAVRRALQQDPAFQELADTPLMLNIMILAYRELSAEKLGQLASAEAQRRCLFDAYVQEMFKRRGTSKRYPAGKVTGWLAHLARKMSQHAQTVFLIERVQPSWLETPTQGKLYGIASRTLSGLIVGISIAAFLGKPHWLVDGAVIGVLLGMISGWHFRLRNKASARKSNIQQTIAAIKRVASVALSVGIATGIYSGFVDAVRWRLFWDPPPFPTRSLLHGLIDGILFGMVGGTLYGIVTGRKSTSGDIVTVETLTWSMKALATGLIGGLLSGAFFGLSFGVIVGIIFVAYQSLASTLGAGLSYGFLDGLRVGIRLGLFTGPALGISALLHYGLIGGELTSKSYPNQGLWLSLRNGALIGLLVAISSTSIFASYSHVKSGLSASRSFLSGFAPRFGFLFGASSGLMGCLLLGGQAVIQHFSLRLILYQGQYLPWRLVDFLDYATERIFLRRVGGGYIFVHRLLQDYFASLYEEEAV